MCSIHRLPSAKPEAQPTDAGTCRCGSRCESCRCHARVEPAVVFGNNGKPLGVAASQILRGSRGERMQQRHCHNLASPPSASSTTYALSWGICECNCEAFVPATDRNLPVARLLGAERQCTRRRRACGCTDVPRALSVSGTAQKTFRCTASAVPGALAAARPPLIAAAVLSRLVRTAAARAAAAPWRSRRCLLSMARALFAEVSLRKLSPQEAHTLTGIRCEAHPLHLPQATVDEESYRQ